MKKIKKLHLFLLVIFIFGAVLLVLTLLPKTKESSNWINDKQTKVIPGNWKQYQNNKHSLSFSYPPDWIFKVITDSDTFLSINLTKEDGDQEKVQVYEEAMTPSYNISITAEANNKGLTARDYYLQNFVLSAQKAAEEQLTNVTVSGIEGIEYSEGAAPSSGPATAVLVSKNDKVYRFTYSAMAFPESHQKYLETFRNLLQSVKIDN